MGRPLLGFFDDILVSDHVQAGLLAILLILINLIQGNLVVFGRLQIYRLKHFIEHALTVEKFLRFEALLLGLESFIKGLYRRFGYSLLSLVDA